jgi:hypothetical protein
MGRGRAFSPLEEQLLREHYDKTIAELEEMLLQHDYRRSRKSINRKLEKMRDEGGIGFRSKDTIRRSYKQRTRRKKLEPGDTDAQSEESWRSSKDQGFDTGAGWDDLD